MRVFVTGATGFIGSAVTEELIAAGHSVTALARSEAAAKKLSARGVQPKLGSLSDMESLRDAAAAADGVIHLAFMHGPSQIPFMQRMGVIFGGLPGGIAARFMKVAAEADRRAIETFGAALQGSGRPLVTTFGTMGLSHVGFRAAKPATEDDELDPLSAGLARARTEENVEALASLGVRATMVRLAPSVHGDGDTGLIPQLISIARKRGRFAYVGDGQNRWPAVHRRDAAKLFRLALEKGIAGARYHGVADEGIAFRSIAEVIGRQLNIPVESVSPNDAAKNFSWFGDFVSTDNPSSSDRTRQELGWEPTEPGLLADLSGPGYFVSK
ncbi:MAG: SDR family oxidoreductase [Cyanobacteria bacterium REEB67]|nr:SDR family oxidoreductase [Cyanobacteria bacterium REEB67]